MAFKITQKEAAEIQKLVAAYEKDCQDLREALIAILDEWESDWSDKSKSWQESDRGQSAQDRIDTLAAWIDEIPEGCTDFVTDLR